MKEAITYLCSKEPVFQQIVSDFGVPVKPLRPQGFETLVLLILEQQVSVDSAKATYLKLRSEVNLIQPENLIHLSEEIYRSCGVSRQKTGYIKGLSKLMVDGMIDLEALPRKSAAEVRDELIRIKGIGHWTIDVYLMFSLNAPDIIPLGDVALVKTCMELFSVTSKEEIEEKSKHWSPHRSAATFLLWHHYLSKRKRKITYNY